MAATCEHVMRTARIATFALPIRSAWNRCSSTWWSFPAVGYRRWRSPGTRDRERGRSTLVSPVSRRVHCAGRRAALDRQAAELELHVRRVPFNECRDGLRRRQRFVYHDLRRDQRRLRRLPWSRLDAYPRGECRHGNGSAWIRRRSRRSRQRNLGNGRTTGIAALSEPRAAPQQQPEACGRCHSRRGIIAPEYEYGEPLAHTHLPALLDETLYYADGQIRDEVYVYGSFLQSAMYRAGVTCSDCHNPHSSELVTGANPNDVCTQCHLPTQFSAAEQRPHGRAGCVHCHMAPSTYMVVDGRRDHGLRSVLT